MTNDQSSIIAIPSQTLKRKEILIGTSLEAVETLNL